MIVHNSRRMISLVGAALLGLGAGLAVTGPAAAEYRRTRRRSLLALALFTVAALLATGNS